MNRPPRIVSDLRSVMALDYTEEQRSKIAGSLSAIAREFESQGLHYQEHIPTAERYLRNARLFEQLAEAARGGADV